MNACEPLTDAQLEAMLTRLTARGRSDGLNAAIMDAVDTTPQQRRPWVRWSDWRLTPAPELRLVWMLAIIGLLLALLAGTLAVGSRLLESRQPLPERLPAPLAGMVTEAVEPGVFRVVNDGVRDLSTIDAVDIIGGYDGGIWLLQEDGFLRLGSDGAYGWPADVAPEDRILEVAPDGTMWVVPRRWALADGSRGGEGLSTVDGEEWTAQSCPGDCAGFTVAPDGTVWASWIDESGRWRVGHLGPAGWVPLDGSIPPDFSPGGFGRLFITETGDVYGSTCIWACALLRHENGAWQRDRDAYMLVDVGPDGTVWQDGGIGTDPDPVEVSGSFPGDGLARFADSEWAGWTSADLPEIRYGLGLDFQFKVAPDGSLWFSLWRSADDSDPRVGDYWRWEERSGAVGAGRLVCDGLAHFDGKTLDHFLPGQCIAMDIAADGSVWVVAGEDEARDLYVIAPETVAPTEPNPSAAPLWTDADTTPEPNDAQTIFHWVGDDLGAWVTEDEMTDALETVAARSFSADLDGRVAADCTRDECEWSFHLVGDPSAWSLRAHTHEGAQDPWRTDPLLPQGATHALGWGHFFAGPHSKQVICLTLSHGSQYTTDEPGFRATYFALASVVLRELGWVD